MSVEVKRSDDLNKEESSRKQTIQKDQPYGSVEEVKSTDLKKEQNLDIMSKRPSAEPVKKTSKKKQEGSPYLCICAK